MSHSLPADQAVRQQALDLTHSFIVQAPAGSGKTQLLTQRFLQSLGCVKQPEEVIAITFTRKAANEMQQRIITALTNTAPATAAHEKTTQALARAVLDRDEAYQWQLLQNPNRLQIMTIDAFCLKLTRQTPVLSQCHNRDQISTDPEQLYRQAVSQILLEIDGDETFSPAIVTLLTHLDNQWDKLTDLLSNLLGRREQWLSLILHIHGLPAQRQALESSLQQVIQTAIEAVDQAIPFEERTTLFSLYQYAAGHCEHLHDLDEWPDANIEQLSFWQSLTTFLMTKNYQWRKRLTKKEGFPPKTQGRCTEEKTKYEMQKKDMLALLDRLSQDQTLLSTLISLAHCPTPTYSDRQWEVIAALLQILPLVAAQLKVVFSQTHTLDYNELNLGAIQALTDQNMPTDLGLLLDYQLKHILIDEFQDTSITQFKLLMALTAGWAPNEGKTLFLVGDPMQSIYRFRQANVGLFLKAKREGIGSIPLHYLQLTVNFRSSPVIIDWVNQCFDPLFPAVEEEHKGAICYAQSVPAKTKSPDDKVQSHLIVKETSLDQDRCLQTQYLISLIQQIQTRQPNAQIAVLVRARSHLSALLPALRAKHLAFSAIDIENLDKQPVIQDLLSLTYALCYPADQIAWLAVLRAPYCGLSLSELTELIAHHEQGTLVLTCIEDPPAHFYDNPRFVRVRNTLLLAWQRRYQKPLPVTLSGLWSALGGPAAYQAPNVLATAHTFFTTLRQHSAAGRLINRPAFEKAIQQCYATPATNDQTTLHIMTLHKAKGLEFDVVILPFLEKSPPANLAQLLQWEHDIDDHNADHILLAPIKNAYEQTHDPIYRYITHQESIRADHELVRLLYVGATRAKHQLHLVGNVDVEYDADKQTITRPKKNALLSRLFDQIDKQYLIHAKDIALDNSSKCSDKQNTLQRLPENWQPPLVFQPISLTDWITEQPTPIPSPLFETAIGTVVHRCLECIAIDGLPHWDNQHLPDCYPLWRQQLHALSVPLSQCDHAIKIINQAINQTLQDEKGRWILSTHTHAANELALTSLSRIHAKNGIIDRTFIDAKNQCWIIDYKTAQPKTPFSSETEKQTWLTQQKEIYITKLQHYATALSQLKPYQSYSPLYIGLYFPLFGGWIAWKAVIPP